MDTGSTSSSGKGQSLGGNQDRPLTSTELRERRLATLQQQQQHGGAALTSPPPPPQVASPLVATPTTTNSVAVEADLDEDEHLQAALALSLARDNHEEDISETMEGVHRTLQMSVFASDVFDIAEFHSTMWDSRLTTDNDKDRWVGQGIDVRHDETSFGPQVRDGTRLTILGSDHLPWGLTQEHGGPCGVMAAVQAEMLCLLLFSPGSQLSYYPTSVLSDQVDNEMASTTWGLEPQRIRQALAMAMAIIVARAALMPSVANGEEPNQEAKIVLPVNYRSQEFTGLSWNDLEPWSSARGSVKSDKFVVHTIPLPVVMDGTAKRQRVNGRASSPVPAPRADRINALANTISSFLEEPHVLNCFTKPGGVVLLLMSMVASRGASAIIRDMDDETSKLTSQFGHCSQELINLLLTGQAVSNVFDNTMTPSGSLTCCGIQQRPAVGYLTQLESLRYCEVGGYYKNPRFPIWVVGSTSHFTVLFGDASCLKESKSDALLEKCRRAFKEVDGIENGFISRLDLPKVYDILKLDIGGEHALQTLAAALEVSGADIILWDDFWKATSRLMTGASLESVLQGDVEDSPLLQLTDQGDVAEMKLPASRPETDEEMAKRLAAEWEAQPASSAEASAPASFMPDDYDEFPPQAGSLSDEEYARKLQAQFDSWGDSNDGATQGAVADDLTTETAEDDEKMPDTNLHVVDLSGGTITTSTTSHHKGPDFETFGDTFSVYHYNGLRGGTLTPFRVTRLSAEEAVGASIAMSTLGGAGGGATGGDLEDVVRTKWPSCMINWLGKSPPYID